MTIGEKLEKLNAIGFVEIYEPSKKYDKNNVSQEMLFCIFLSQKERGVVIADGMNKTLDSALEDCIFDYNKTILTHKIIYSQSKDRLAALLLDVINSKKNIKLQ